MKRQLAPLLVALSLCALLGGARAAEAQRAEAIVPAAIDSGVAAAPAMLAASSDQVGGNVVDLGPVIRPSSLIPGAPTGVSDTLADAYAPALGRNWKMPTSRTLMIGGTAAALIGLMAVKGDAGAIIAMAGGGVAVYGLYLHYNR